MPHLRTTRAKAGTHITVSPLLHAVAKAAFAMMIFVVFVMVSVRLFTVANELALIHDATGLGKDTLSIMTARRANCESLRQPGEFCDLTFVGKKQ